MTFLNRVLHLINEARFKKSKDHPQPKETQHEFDYAKFLKVTPKASQEMRKFIRHGGAMGYDVADPRGSRTRRIFKRNESNMNYIQRIYDLLVEAQLTEENPFQEFGNSPYTNRGGNHVERKIGPNRERKYMYPRTTGADAGKFLGPSVAKTTLTPSKYREIPNPHDERDAVLKMKRKPKGPIPGEG